VQVAILILLLLGLGALAYLVWEHRRLSRRTLPAVETLRSDVADLAQTVETLKKLPVKGIEAGPWVESLQAVQKALEGPEKRISEIETTLKELDETYRANFQVLADLTQEKSKAVTDAGAADAARLEERLDTTLTELKEVGRKDAEAGRANLEDLTQRLESQLKDVESAVQDRLRMQEADSTERHTWVSDAADRLESEVARIRESVEQAIAELKDVETREAERVRALQEALSGRLGEGLAGLEATQMAQGENLAARLDEVDSRIDQTGGRLQSHREALQTVIQDELNALLQAQKTEASQISSSVQGLAQMVESDRISVAEWKESILARWGRLEEWREDVLSQLAKSEADAHDLFSKIEGNLDELIAEIAARHTAQMSLLADEFDQEQGRYLDLVSRAPDGRTRDEEEPLFRQLVEAHGKTSDRFSRHYYLRLIFSLPQMRREAFDYFFERTSKHLPTEVERCSFEQLRTRFEQIEAVILEYAVSDENGLADYVSEQWHGMTEKIRPALSAKVRNVLDASYTDEEEELRTLRSIPRDWLEPETKMSLLSRIRQLAGTSSDRVPSGPLQNDPDPGSGNLRDS